MGFVSRPRGKIFWVTPPVFGETGPKCETLTSICDVIFAAATSKFLLEIAVGHLSICAKFGTKFQKNGGISPRTIFFSDFRSRAISRTTEKRVGQCTTIFFTQISTYFPSISRSLLPIEFGVPENSGVLWVTTFSVNCTKLLQISIQSDKIRWTCRHCGYLECLEISSRQLQPLGSYGGKTMFWG